MATVEREVQLAQSQRRRPMPFQRSLSFAQQCIAPAPPKPPLENNHEKFPESSKVKLPSRSYTGSVSQASSRPSEGDSSDDEVFDHCHEASDSEESIPDNPPEDKSTCLFQSDQVSYEVNPPPINKKRGADVSIARPSKRQQVSPPVETMSACSSFSSFSSFGAPTPGASTDSESSFAVVDGEVKWDCPMDLHREPYRKGFCHERCPRFSWSVDVRRHLVDWHRCIPFCPVCGAEFDTQTECNAHIVERSCELTEKPPVVEGLSEGQIDELECLDWDEGLSETKRYRMLWDVVFPGEQMPTV